MGLALVTDLYELNMAASYLRRHMGEAATFSLFVRKLPSRRGFLVAGGLEDCLTYLESFSFAEEDLDWLRRSGFDAETVERMGSLRFTGDVHAVPEGRVVLPNEPFLEVTAPLPEAQLFETFLVNQITYQTALATKAARCRLAAGTIELVDFSLRRTHGVEAGMAVARQSAIAGFVGTSNVEAARRFGLVASGTMAHSYVQAFPSEDEAFACFAEDRPPPHTFLVDTYDTLAGVDAAIRTIHRLGLTGPLAVRLDSGDLAGLAWQTRRRLDAAGLAQVRIFVSGGLDEFDLEHLRDAHAPVDAAGVGTRLGVSADAPSLDSAYKLVAYDGRPLCKLSVGKATLPGAKQVWRRLPGPDVLSTRTEPGPPGTEPLLVPVMRQGERVDRALPPAQAIEAARRRLERDLDALPAMALDLHHPIAPEVVPSDLLAILTATVRDELGRRHLGRSGAPHQ